MVTYVTDLGPGAGDDGGLASPWQHAAAAAAAGGGGGGPLPGLAAWALVRVGMSAKHLIITTHI